MVDGKGLSLTFYYFFVICGLLIGTLTFEICKYIHNGKPLGNHQRHHQPYSLLLKESILLKLHNDY